MRLIDADALIEAHYQHCNKHHDDAFEVWSLKLMRNAPTIDAVPKTQCRDCQFSGRYSGIDLRKINATG